MTTTEHSGTPPHEGGAGAGDSPGRESDFQLVRAMQAGDPAAWLELLSRYQHRLYALCLRMSGNPDDAADLTQDVMVKIVRGIPSYDGRAALLTWMIRICMNHCLTWLRAKKVRKTVSLSYEGGVERSDNTGPHGSVSGSSADGELSGVERVQQSERRQLVARALSLLPDEQRSILVLRDVQGLEYDQVAEILAIAVGTVKSRLFRARLALRKQVESMESRGTSER